MASAALKKAVKAILRGNPVLNYLAGVELCRRARGLDARGLVDLAFGFKVGFKALGMHIIRPWQVRSELLRLAELVAELRPARVLEIGTFNGGTLFLWCRLAPPGSTIISLDLPGGLFGGGYPSGRIPLYKAMCCGRRLRLIRADSHDPSTLKKVEEALGGARLDFLFIDGDHRYEGVRRDFEMYSPLVREGGVVAFHDIVPHRLENVGVPEFWREIKQRYKHAELVEDWGQGWAGIGVLFV